ncbi:S1 family peptidase [Streptomyces meridianus]|uniref:S1 family peptidase n=1 Tax=Streptomyces meridianus TaxID=2938945 RepID=A0ABT0X203_9ACTN|nr:S1 family peptidase [Streptomyces meridianus]MCM2576582.1 S1 family peptidase [Streptomyces meridianus]
MKHRRITKRGTSIAAAGAAAVIAGALTFSYASASQAPSERILSVEGAGRLATSLVADLDGRTAGSFYDAKSRKLVVNVVDESAAERVRDKGAVAKIVAHTLGELNSARATLKSKATIPGTSWSIDPRSNKVVVTADSTVKGAKLAKLTEVTRSLGGKVEVNRSAGEFEPFVAGGDAIWGGSSRCSLGFNVVRNGEPYFLTAGHCTAAVQSWSDTQGGAQIGVTEEGSFPGDDYGLVKYTAGTDHPSEVDLYNGSAQAITQAGEATVGQQVQRSGSTTQLHDGQVTGLDETVNYQEGTVEGLIKTDVCAEPGDSGGAMFSGSTALGLTSGGSGDCSAGGTTFFQPVTEALDAYGAEIG